MTASRDARSDGPRVLVGVDGSEESQQALAWAADYAGRTGGTLELACAWHWPLSYGYPIVVAGLDPEGEARETLDKAAAGLTLPPDRIRKTLLAGPPAQQLADASRLVDLLVVGSRGHGGFTGMLLGSVSTHLVHAARCPVVVVRPDSTG